MEATGNTVIPDTTAASEALAMGTKQLVNFSSLAIIAIGKTPWTYRTVPSRESSPTNKEFARSASIVPDANKIPKAIGKSYAGPSFGISAGARLIVIRLGGKSIPEL